MGSDMLLLGEPGPVLWSRLYSSGIRHTMKWWG